MNAYDAAEKLTKDGWTEWGKGHDAQIRTFYRRFPTPTQCALNRDKDGVPAGFALISVGAIPTCQVQVCGQLGDGKTDVTFRQCGLLDNAAGLRRALASIPDLLRLWERVAVKPNQKEKAPRGKKQ